MQIANRITMKTYMQIGFASLAIVLMTAYGYGEKQSGEGDTQKDAARGVLKRWIPEYADQFILELISRGEHQDIFEIESRDKKIVLRGSNGVSLCSALNWYLKYYCHTDITWNGVQLNLPDPLPPMEKKIQRRSPHKYRYFFNYCCFGYSMPWWDWSQWEKMIDWLALNGFNMPLSVTGQEAIWQKTLRKLDIPQNAVTEFLAGPPYLPFGWMGCLDGWGGPLSQNWIDEHAELQKKIIARERSLGMTPVLQGFTGHVPHAIKEKYPEANLHKIHWVEWETYFLDPLDPLFQKVGKTFLEMQQNEFGTDHLYAADTFIEMSPPSNDPTFLHNMGKSLYQSMAAVDPDGIWVMQGWIFYNNAAFWKPPQSKAFLGGVPDDGMLLLDLFCDVSPVWNKTDAFYGKPWVWCILPNFGNTIRMSGPLAKINADLWSTMDDPERGKMSGIGIIQEGLGYNPVVFDLMAEMTWRSEPIDLDEWIEQYAYRRYGQKLPEATQAWKQLLKTAYNGTYGTTSLTHRPGLGSASSQWPYDREKFEKAWELLLQCSDQLKSVDTYQFDVANITRQALSNLSGSLFTRILSIYQKGDRKAFEEATQEYVQLIRDFDELLGTRKEFLLGRWLEDAKRWGKDEAQKDIFEWNARNIITLWGDRESRLHDYARKEWSGMLTGFYLPRWQLLFDHMRQSLQEDQPFDQKKYTQEVQILEEKWTHKNDVYPTQPTGDTVKTTNRLFKKYHNKTYKYGTIQHLAINKPVTASSSLPSHSPANAVNGLTLDKDSGWWADPYPQWLQIDLEKVYWIDCIHPYFYWDGERYYQYTIEISTDGQQWNRIVDQSDNTELASPKGAEFQFDPVKARFIRIHMRYNSANKGVHITEFKVREHKIDKIK